LPFEVSEAEEDGPDYAWIEMKRVMAIIAKIDRMHGSKSVWTQPNWWINLITVSKKEPWSSMSVSFAGRNWSAA
jgi:hypothetical protein